MYIDERPNMIEKNDNLIKIQLKNEEEIIKLKDILKLNERMIETKSKEIFNQELIIKESNERIVK